LNLDIARAIVEDGDVGDLHIVGKCGRNAAEQEEQE
jgi:hypothetical protein